MPRADKNMYCFIAVECNFAVCVRDQSIRGSAKQRDKQKVSSVELRDQAQRLKVTVTMETELLKAVTKVNQ